REGGKNKRKAPERVPDPREKHNEILDWRLLPGGILAIKLEKNPKDVLKKMFGTPGYEDMRIIAAVSSDIDVHDDTELIWGIFTRFDPYLDVIFERTELRGSAVVYGGRMGIDATIKSWYPLVIEMSEDVRDKVTERWKEYWMK
ncbi:MAG: UbiD family decarboxylase, partial [Candidatus Dadabacteria bacterium]|nr:UbiD family decarboxylase [Candidatus Dadabacteria bacterium]